LGFGKSWRWTIYAIFRFLIIRIVLAGGVFQIALSIPSSPFASLSPPSIMSCTVKVVSEKDDIPVKAIDGKPTYVYWKILGLAQSARLALAAAQIDFVDVQISAEESKDGWIAAKHTPEMRKALTFPNLPYFLHPDLGDQGLVQVSTKLW
jgi:hypothetical protein